MIKSTKTYTRPNTTVSFFNHQAEINQETKIHMKTTYIDTGKMVSTETSTSPDQLTITAVVTWFSQADLDQFTNDPIIVNGVTGLRSAYNAAFGITESTVVEEI